MKPILTSLLAAMLYAGGVYAEPARTPYYVAKQQLEQMLDGKESLSYERAVFLVENAWHDDSLSYDNFSKELDFHTRYILDIAAARYAKTADSFEDNGYETAAEQQRHYGQALANYAIYSYLTDTTYYLQGGMIRYQLPLAYAVQDPMGTTDWTNTQVGRLLRQRQGNCYAMAALYRIYAERLGTDAALCTAPGHLYIRHADDKGTRYNIELATGAFPGTGTLAAYTYTTDAAIKNNIALRELDLRQSIALCLVYLAKGYEHRYGVKADEFVMACADAALRYDAQSLNAMLLKAEALEEKLVKQGKTIKQLAGQDDYKAYNSLLKQLSDLGYREMPYDMKNLLVKGWTRDTVTQLATKEYDGSAKHAGLSWGLFDEEIKTKTLERYGNTIYNTKTEQIAGFVPGDILYNQYNFDPVVFAWNVDPLAHKFPHQSPYAAMDGSPIWKNDPTGAAGEVVIYGNTMTIRSHFVFYGGAVTPERAAIAVQNIQNQWNSGKGTLNYGGKEYKNVMFVVTSEILSEEAATNRAAQNVGDNFDPQLNFARIEVAPAGQSSEFAGEKGPFGDNSFYFRTQDIYKGSTVQAHEYGHGLGGAHNALKTFVDGIPNIMSTIYNGVQAPFSEDGETSVYMGDKNIPLHRMNQNCRQVLQADFNQVRFTNYKRGVPSKIQVGSSSNVLFDKNGTTINGKAQTIKTGE